MGVGLTYANEEGEFSMWCTVHEDYEMFTAVPSVSFTDGLRAVRLKLWDEQAREMVTWKQARSR